MPWRSSTLIGATWTPVAAPDAGPLEATREEVLRFVDRLTREFPGLGLSPSRIRYATVGLYPVFGTETARPDVYELPRRALVHDHGARGGPKGLVTAIPVKLTTARALGERVVDVLAAHVDRFVPASATAGHQPLRFAAPSSLPGVGFDAVSDPGLAARLARVAAEQEMARSLTDVLLRRSAIGLHGRPARDVLRAAAEALAEVHGWSVERTRSEVRDVEELYGRILPGGTPEGGSA